MAGHDRQAGGDISPPLGLSQTPSSGSTQGRRAFVRQGGGCRILYLTLGPLELDLFGLVVEPPNELVIVVRAERQTEKERPDAC